jgi:hypothetical protein
MGDIVSVGGCVYSRKQIVGDLHHPASLTLAKLLSDCGFFPYTRTIVNVMQHAVITRPPVHVRHSTHVLLENGIVACVFARASI